MSTGLNGDASPFTVAHSLALFNNADRRLQWFSSVFLSTHDCCNRTSRESSPWTLVTTKLVPGSCSCVLRNTRLQKYPCWCRRPLSVSAGPDCVVPSHDHILTPNLPPARPPAFFFFSISAPTPALRISLLCPHSCRTACPGSETGHGRAEKSRAERSPRLKPGFSLMIYERHITEPPPDTLLPRTHSVLLLGFGFQRGDDRTTGGTAAT